MTDHTVRAFDRELELLGRKIAEMGGIGEKMLADAIDALIRLDADLARETVAMDKRLDLLQREVEEEENRPDSYKAQWARAWLRHDMAECDRLTALEYPEEERRRA